MAERKAVAAEIVARVRKVPGWKVTVPRRLVGGAYKITAPNGETVQVHSSPSDVNFEHVIWRELNRHGFEKDEAAAERKHTREKKAKLAAEAKAANEKATQLASQSHARRKAAGPYMNEPEAVGIDWFAKQHPAPWPRLVWMTPELSKYLLDNHNTDNRPWGRKTVDEYKQKIRDGHWGLTHQGGAMDTRAVLQDSQHRLIAIDELGEEDPDLHVPMVFWVGMPVENFKRIDEGKNRRPQDLLGKDGESYGIVISGCVRLVVAFTSKVPKRTIRMKTANETIYDAFQDDAELLRQAARWGSNNTKKILVGQSPLAAAYYLIGKRNGFDNPYFKAFMYGLANEYKQPTRTHLDDFDPRVVVRNNFRNARANKKRADGLSTLCLIIMAWNNVVLEKRPTYMRFMDDTPIPEILICKPDSAAVPTMLRGEVDQ